MNQSEIANAQQSLATDSPSELQVELALNKVNQRLAIRQIKLDEFPPLGLLQQGRPITLLKLPSLLLGRLPEHALQFSRSHLGHRDRLNLTVLRSSEVPVHVAEHWRSVKFIKRRSDLVLDLIHLVDERLGFFFR